MKTKSFLFSAFALLALVSCGAGTSENVETSVDNSEETSVVSTNEPTSTAPTSVEEISRTVSIVWKEVYSADTNLSSYTKDGVTVTFAKASGTNDPKYYNSANYEAARLYAGNTMTVAGQDITRIEMSYVSYTNKDGLFEASVGNLVTSNDRLSDVWTGKTNSVTFTVTELQRRISSMTITLGGSGTVTPTDPTSTEEPGTSTTYTILGVAQDIATALETEYEEYDGDYYISIEHENAQITDSTEILESLDAELPEYLELGSEIEESTWYDGDAGYFVYYYTPDESVALEIGTYMDDTTLVVQIAVCAYSTIFSE